MFKKILRLVKKVDNNIDIPDERDIPYEVLFGSENNSNKIDVELIKNRLNIFNQGLDPITKMSCGCCGMTHLSNCFNIQEYYNNDMEYNQLSPKNIWVEYLKTNPDAQYEGSSLQEWLKIFTDKKLISGYTKLLTIDEAKNALDSGRLIYTGSLNGDWNKVKIEHIYGTKSKSYGHLFTGAIGYNNEGFVAINSYGPDNGFFIIPYEYWDTLYTRYAISDQKDLGEYSFYNTAKEIIKNTNLEGYSKYYFTIARKFGSNSTQAKTVRFIGQNKFKVRVQEKIDL